MYQSRGLLNGSKSGVPMTSQTEGRALRLIRDLLLKHCPHSGHSAEAETLITGPPHPPHRTTTPSLQDHHTLLTGPPHPPYRTTTPSLQDHHTLPCWPPSLEPTLADGEVPLAHSSKPRKPQKKQGRSQGCTKGSDLRANYPASFHPWHSAGSSQSFQGISLGKVKVWRPLRYLDPPYIT